MRAAVAGCHVAVVCHVIGHVAGTVAGDASGAVVGVLAASVLAGAVWLLAHVLGAVLASTAPQLGAGWMHTEEQSLRVVAELVLGPLLGVATLGAVLRRDPHRLGRIWGVGLPVAVLTAAVAVVGTAAAVRLVDGLCAMVTPHDTLAPFERIGRLEAFAAAPSFVQLIVALLVVTGAVFIWMELVLRTVAIDITVVFLPLALAAFVWPTTAAIARRTVEVLVALIGSKFVIVVTLVLGAGALGHGQGVATTVTGTGILLVAAFAPFTLLRLVPLLEAGAIGHLEGVSHRPARAAVRTGSAAMRGHQQAARLLGAGRGGDSARPGVSAVGATAMTRRGGDYALGAAGGAGSSGGDGSSGTGSPPSAAAGGSGAGGGGDAHLPGPSPVLPPPVIGHHDGGAAS